MKKIVFDFLDSMEVKEIEKAPVGGPVERTPAPGADLRLFADGSIYPSKELVDLHQLEFQPKDSLNPANGYDVFVSSRWEQYNNTSKSAVPFVCLALTSKHNNKVDLFSQVRYNDDGTPKSSVLTQKTAAGLSLIKALGDVYLDDPTTESIFGTSTHVDLKILLNTPLHKSPTGVYHIPKLVERGKDKGKSTYERRELSLIYPVVIAEAEAKPETVAAPVIEEATPAKQAPVSSVANALWDNV